MTKSIYIADDDDNIRRIMESFLINDGFSVSSFDNGDKLLACFLKRPSDMIILDIMMDGTDGLSICAKIRERNNVPIIIVSARDSELDRIAGITLGSDDYLVKPFSPIELVARVKALFRRIALDLGGVKQDTLKYADMTLNMATRDCMAGSKKIDLTPTEFALLSYMFKNSERAVSRDELLKNVWKFDFEADTRVIDDALKRLRKKLSIGKVRIESVWGFGFKLSEAI